MNTGLKIALGVLTGVVIGYFGTVAILVIDPKMAKFVDKQAQVLDGALKEGGMR